MMMTGTSTSLQYSPSGRTRTVVQFGETPCNSVHEDILRLFDLLNINSLRTPHRHNFPPPAATT